MRGMDWIDLAQDRDRRQAVVKAAMNLRFPLNAGNLLLAKDLLAYQEGLLH
jgi:hypothetical protein